MQSINLEKEKEENYLSTRSNISKSLSPSIFDNDEFQVYGEIVRDFYQDGQRLLYDDDLIGKS